MSLTGRALFAAKATQNFRTTCATLISSSGEYCCSTKHTRPRSTAILSMPMRDSLTNSKIFSLLTPFSSVISIWEYGFT